jgi:hypothetical protein
LTDKIDSFLDRARAKGCSIRPTFTRRMGLRYYISSTINEKQEPAILVELQFDAVAVWVSDVQCWSLAKSPTDALELLLDLYVGLP